MLVLCKSYVLTNIAECTLLRTHKEQMKQVLPALRLERSQGADVRVDTKVPLSLAIQQEQSICTLLAWPPGTERWGGGYFGYRRSP